MVEVPIWLLAVGLMTVIFTVALAISHESSVATRRDPMVCRDCGSQMVERYPHAVGARRYTICNVCGYFDSYIDHERVRKAREPQP
jgi:formate dehydrogenase maturation protein FdhE